MLKKFFTNKNLILYLSLFMISFLVLAFASECSFIYPTNSWVDPNCYLTVAKAMVKGKVLYTDIFEQKGPYVYFLHVICYLITPDSFLGVYLLEVLLAFISCCIIVQILKHYGINSVKKQIITCLVYSIIVYFSRSFAQGDSVEELINPLLLLTIYLTIKDKNKPLTYLLVGIIAGFVFWVKFSLIGVFIGWYIYKLIYIFKEKNYKEIAYSIPLIILGVVIASIIPAVYFISVDNISTLFTDYILDNLKYQSEHNIFVKILLCIWYTIKSIYENYTYTLPILVTIGLIIFKFRKIYFKELLFIIISFCCSAFLIFIGGRHYVYYGLPLNIYSVFFFVLLFKEDFKINKTKTFAIISGAILSLSCVFTIFLSGQVYYMFRKKETLVQYKFAQIISEQENATILNYSFLDGGFYLFANYLPQNKYFCTLNNKNLTEMHQEHEEMLLNKEVDFVIIRTDKLKELDLTKYDYHEVDRVSQRFHLATVFTYILYQKN